MIAIRKLSDNVVTHLFKGTDVVQLSPFGLTGPGVNDSGFTTADYEEVTVTDPGFFVPSAMTWDDGWTTTDTTNYNAVYDRVVAQSRAQASQLMVDWISEFLRQFTDGYPVAEMNAWPAKAAAARAYLATTSTTDQDNLIDTEADEKGRTGTSIATEIVANADVYETIIARVSGLRSTTYASIQTAQPHELDGILSAAKARAQSLLTTIAGGS